MENPAQNNAAVEQVLAGMKAKMGFVPQLMADMGALSPAALLSYATMAQITGEHCVLTKAEQMALQLFISAKNACDYCVGAHGKVAAMMRIDAADIAAMAKGEIPQKTENLKALCEYAAVVWEKRGMLTQQEQGSWAARGVTAQKQMDVVAIFALKTLTNYGHHITHTQLDRQLQ